jgi:predicted branched-subunit amino acid permease
MAPLALAVTPLGLTVGVAFGQLPVDHMAAWSTSWLIYGASAQLLAVSTYAADPTGVAAILAVIAINVRLAFYGAAVAPHWRTEPWYRRLLGGYLLIEPSFAQAVQRQAEPGSARAKFRHYLAGGLVLWLWWQLVIAAGTLIPALIPDLDGLWAVGPLCFVAIVVNAVRDRAALIAAVAGGIVAFAAAGLPWGTGLLIAMVTGLCGGAASKERQPR